MEMNSTLINHLNALGCASSLTSFFVFFFFFKRKVEDRKEHSAESMKHTGKIA